jgi:uncharacterized protein with PQ loop repeat
MQNYSQLVGIGAGICTGISLLPQLIKIIKEKRQKIFHGNAGDIIVRISWLDLVWLSQIRFALLLSPILFHC